MFGCVSVRNAWVVVLSLSAVWCGPERVRTVSPAPASALDAALACPYDATLGFDIGCAAYSAWLQRLADQRQDPDGELFELLDTTEVARRWLGAASLLRRGRSYVDGTRIFDALERERDPAVASLLAQAAGRVRHADLRRRATRIVTTHPIGTARELFLSSLRFHHRDPWVQRLSTHGTTQRGHR